MAKDKVYEQHPLALELTPGSMTEEEFKALADDIEARGQRLEITLFENKILDGMNRYRACVLKGIEPKYIEYEGDDPTGLVISLNVLRRRQSTMQRALAGARLNMNYGITQDEASRRVGVSKVHINLVAQAIKSNNARVIKMLENPDLTREKLHDEMVDCNIIMASTSRPVPAAHLSQAGAATGLDSVLHGFVSGEGVDGDDPLLDDGTPEEDPELDQLLGAPPSAGGKVITFKGGTTEGGNPIVGSKPGHPERRPKETPASMLADKFRGLTEGDQVSFMQLTWHLQRKLLKVAGLSVEAPASAIAAQAIAKAANGPAPAGAPAKGPKASKRVKAA